MPGHNGNDSIAILVRKYGGSSLASVDRIRQVARDLVAKRDEGYRMVVVVSAMGRTTDDLQHLAEQISAEPPRRELDMLLSVGERITMSLLSMALQAEGCSAISFTGSQCGIITDNSHTDARVIEVKADRVRESLADGHVVIVAGFQGVSREREITTLGRGGSDTSAVALAAALGAERCEILKDVDGVFTADPGSVPAARRHPRLSYQQMETIAAAGCGVIHERAVAFARKHAVRLLVGSSFNDSPGTDVGPAAPPNPAAPAKAVGKGGSRGHPVRWRPLSLVVQEEIALLELDLAAGSATDDRRSRLAAAAAESRLITEWIHESADSFRWGILAAPEVASGLHTLVAHMADSAGCRCGFRRGLTSVNIAGDPPESWLSTRDTVAALLAADGVSDWRLLTSGPALRLLLPPAAATRLLPALHRALFED